MRPAVLPLFAILLSGAALSARADTLSLDEAIHEAVEKSPAAELARSSAEESTWRQREALSGFLPKVNLNANHFISEKFQLLDVSLGGNNISFPAIYPTTTYSADVSLTLFDGLANIARFQGANLLSDAADRNLDWSVFQVSEQVRIQFYRALAAMKLRDVAEQNVKTLQDHLDKVNTLLRGGAATNFDVLRVEVQFNEAKTDLISAEDNIVLARKQLAQAMGIDDDARTLAGDLPTPTPVDTEHLSPEAAKRADIDSLMSKSEAAGKQHLASESHWYPRVWIAYNYQRYNDINNAMTGSAFRNAYNLGLFATWNIFDGFGSYSRQREAAEQAHQAETALRAAQLKLPTDLEFWKRRYRYNSTLYQARLSDVEKSQESVRLAVEGLRAGTRTNTEVLDAELELFRSRAGLVRAQLDAAEALANLELAVGKKL